MQASHEAAQIFRDAVALWHMGDAAGRNGAVTTHGDATLGIELAGPERQASLARGGDGKVAQFAGGWLVAGSPGTSFDLTGKKAMTLCLRLRDPAGRWDTPLLGRDDPDDPWAAMLWGDKVEMEKVGFRETQRISGGQSIEFRWRTEPLENRVTEEFLRRDPTDWLRLLCDAPRVVTQRMKSDYLHGLMPVSVPAELIGPGDWHDLIVRFTGPAIELFIDGVLVDEEWPHGALYRFAGPLIVGGGYEDGKARGGFHGQVDHLAVWDRALGDAEVAALSGGKQQADRRRLEIHGPPLASPQYWRPTGHNSFVGDCMAFFHDGRLHVYYLSDRRHTCSKWRMGGCGYAHLSTADLVRWEQHPMALSITEQTECALGTGCFVFHRGIHHLFYVEHGRRQFFKDSPYRGDNIFLATSTDGLHFEKRREPVIRLEYTTGDDINPHVLLTARDGQRHLITMSGWKTFASEDLVHWEEVEHEGLKQIKWICTTDFSWNGWHYFTGQNHYRMSRTPLDRPRWEEPANRSLGDRLLVPVAVPFAGGRFLLIGAGKGSWGQEMIFRELVQHEDGSLGLKWPEEMIPASGEPLKLSFEPVKGRAAMRGQAIHLGGGAGFSAGALDGLPANVRITARVVPGAGIKQFGVCVRGTGAYAGGCELKLDPQWKRVQYGEPMDGRTPPVSIGLPKIDDVERLDRPITLDLIVKDDLVDTCIDNRKTLLTRITARGDRLFFFALDGQVTFEDVRVRPLLPS